MFYDLLRSKASFVSIINDFSGVDLINRVVEDVEELCLVISTENRGEREREISLCLSDYGMDVDFLDWPGLTVVRKKAEYWDLIGLGERTAILLAPFFPCRLAS